MKIPLQAQVECKDGIFGRSMYVLIDPVKDQITHVVVKEDKFPYTKYNVPLDVISTTTADTIRLDCARVKIKRMDPFDETEYIEEKALAADFQYAGGAYGIGSYYLMPYLKPDATMRESTGQLQIPVGELMVRRGTRVEATDGYVGRVDEFVVDSENGHVAYLVMEEGHLWGKENVIIPVSAIDETHSNTVFLKLDKQNLRSLPNFPLSRR